MNATEILWMIVNGLEGEWIAVDGFMAGSNVAACFVTIKNGERFSIAIGVPTEGGEPPKRTVNLTLPANG